MQKENLLWYNLSIKGGFTMNNTLFEQFGGTYTLQGDYFLSNLTLSAEEETGYIGVWETTQVNLLKAPPQSFVLQSAHFRQTPFPPCRYRGTSPTTFSPAGKTIR